MTRAAAISTGPDTHLDHLGVLAALLQIPLIVTEQKTFELAQTFYPQADVILKDYSELSLDYLAQNFDALFECGKYWAASLLPLFESFYRKKMRMVFCPHGNSDKGRSLNSSSSHVEQDIALVYGDHMLDLLKKNGAFSKIGSTVVTGNYRLPFYLKHQAFYDESLSKILPKGLDKSKKTIFYAPTWNEKENPSSFFDVYTSLIEELSPFFNILIKLHPFLEEHHPALSYSLYARYEDSEQVFFLNEFPPIYPILAKTDIYIGDFSSIGYDFLAFDRPLYFFDLRTNDPSKLSNSFLHRAGMTIPLSQRGNLYQFITETLRDNQVQFSSIRRELYQHAFGVARDPFAIKNDIFELLHIQP